MARPDSKQKVTLTAKAASLSMDRSGHWLRIECSDGCVEMEGVGTYSFPETFVHDVPLVEPRPDRENAASPAALAATSIPWQVARERSLIRHLESQTADADSHLEPDTKRLGEIERHHRRLLRLRAEIPRRMSNGFACMCFAMIGIPISLRARTLDTMSTFFICFAPVMLVYYPLLVIGENLARGGILPELSVWLADAVLLAVGCLFLHRVARN